MTAEQIENNEPQNRQGSGGGLPLISVVIPVYNVEQYLDECVQSVLSQTYSNLEVILVDDGSQDSCSSKCDSYCDPRVRVIHQVNKGVSDARNNGVAASTGEYITFIDSDDFVSSIYVEQLYTTLSGSGSMISASSYTYDNEALSDECVSSYKKFSCDEAIREILMERDIQPSSWGKLFHRSIVEAVPFPSGRIYEDYYTAPRFFDIAGSVAFTDNKTYYYRTNRESITKSRFNKRHLSYFAVAKDVNDYLRSTHPRLLSLARGRDVNMALSFMRKTAKEKEHDAEAYNMLLKVIREGLNDYLKSGYPSSKKAAALAMALFPRITARFL